MSLPTSLRTARLLLRPWRIEDAPALHAALAANLDRLRPWVPGRVSDPSTLDAIRERIAGYADDFASGRAMRYAVVPHGAAAPVGEAGLYPRNAEGRVPLAAADRVELGYWLAREGEGKGYVTEAVAALLDVAAAFPALRSAEIRADAANPRSWAVAERLGFTLAQVVEVEAVLPDAPPVQLQVWARGLRAGGRAEGRTGER